MKKYAKLFSVLLALVLAFTCLLAGCGEKEKGDQGEEDVPFPPAAVLPSSISLSGMRTQFAYGEPFDRDGLVVTITMTDGSTRRAATSEYACDFSRYDAYTAGEYVITVKLKEYDLSQSYTVSVAQEVVHRWDEDGALKILTIGNSFSDDAMEYAWKIADSLGVAEVYLGNLYIGGCTLDTHATNALNDAAAYEYRVNANGTWSTTPNYKMGDAIAAQDWDFVSLQQASGSSGQERTFGRLQELADYVKATLPDSAHAKLVWHMTWAYQGNSSHGEFAKYDRDQFTMYQKIVETVESKVLPKRDFAQVIPSGTAVQNARTSYVGDTLTRDGYHLTLDLGRYIAGLTLVHQLTGLPIDNISFAPAGVGYAEKMLAIESAKNAVKTPFAVTPSLYLEPPALDLSAYDELPYTLTQGFYNSTDPNNFSAVITNNGSLTPKFFATERFTKEQIPVGSVLVIEEGWQYRPESWTADVKQTARPNNVTTHILLIDESWWEGYLYRAFNLSRVGLPVITGQEEEARAAFHIYVPKS